MASFVARMGARALTKLSAARVQQLRADGKKLGYIGRPVKGSRPVAARYHGLSDEQKELIQPVRPTLWEAQRHKDQAADNLISISANFGVAAEWAKGESIVVVDLEALAEMSVKVPRTDLDELVAGDAISHDAIIGELTDEQIAACKALFTNAHKTSALVRHRKLLDE